MPTLELPGLIDIHVHLRDPGATHKEDFSTGTAAALAGGVVAVVDMPNNTPPTVDESTLRQKIDLARKKARCDFAFYLGASTSNATQPAPDHHLAGLKMYVDETYGPLRVRDLPTLMAHFRSWPRNRPIAAHAEGLSAAIVIGLAQLYDRQVHVCHVSRKAEIELVKQSKERGSKVTCEVTPHHLFLTEDDAKALGGYGQMKPPPEKEEDREALWANLAVIDAVASDHAPHTKEEKEGNTPPPGVPGLETNLPLLLDAMIRGQLSLEQLIRLTHDGPARVLGIQPPEGAYVEVDPEASYVLRGVEQHTKCQWTPFEGMTVQGRVKKVYLRGTKVYEDGQVLAPPGSGQPLVLV
jgi:carbamoyl-phosphate synthase/aspartate carbamoyltransferase/dihydroorotase